MSNKLNQVAWADLSAAIQANPQRGLSLGNGMAFSLMAMPDTPTTLEWMSGGWTEDTTFTIPDVVSFVLWIRDPLYRAAAPSLRRAMEVEEAQALLHGSEQAWSDQHGRSRGWVRKHLEEDLRARASGAEPAPDAWEAVRTQRRAALLVDYVCVMRGVRVALWWPGTVMESQRQLRVAETVAQPLNLQRVAGAASTEKTSVTMIPGNAGPVAQLNAVSGHVLMKADGTMTMEATEWPALVSEAQATWFPAPCAPSIGSSTVAQIQERLALIDPSADRTGNRATLWTRLMWVTLLASLRPSE
jgi:hypothetical protein